MRRFRAKHSSDTICEWVAMDVVAMATVQVQAFFLTPVIYPMRSQPEILSGVSHIPTQLVVGKYGTGITGLSHVQAFVLTLATSCSYGSLRRFMRPAKGTLHPLG